MIVAFVPVFFLDGLSGAFFRPLALAYVLAILASLVVALTVTPALALMLLPRARRSSAASRRWCAWLQRGYAAAAAAARPHGRGRRYVAVARRRRCSGLARLPLLGQAFLPDFKERDFLMHWVDKPGTSLEAMVRITDAGQQGAARDPGRAQLRLAHRPGAEVADEVVGAELHRDLDQRRPEGRLRRDRRRRSRRSSTATPACTATCRPTSRSGSRRC